MPKRRPDESLPPMQFSEVTGLDEAMQPRQPGQSRVVVAGLVGVVLLVIAVGLIQRRLPFLQYSAVTVTTSSTSDTGTIRAIQLQTNINYGILLNGQPVQATSGQSFQLPAAPNTLALHAPPFLPLGCTITWPPDEGSGNCQSNGTTSDSSLVGEIYDVNFQVGIDDLPTDQRSQVSAVVLDAIQRASATITLHVPMGDYYAYAYAANGLPLSRRATVPLTASLSVAALAPNLCGQTICPDTSSISPEYQTPTVNFAINPDYVWSFAAHGNVVNTFHTSNPQQQQAGAAQPLTIGLSYSAAQGWQGADPNGGNFTANLAAQSTNEICFLGANAILPMLQGANPQTSGFGFPHVSAQGCQIDFYSQANPNTPVGSFIDRFGAVLAANAGAHTLLPQVPMAPKDEIQIVQSSN